MCSSLLGGNNSVHEKKGDLNLLTIIPIISMNSIVLQVHHDALLGTLELQQSAIRKVLGHTKFNGLL